MTWLAIVEHEYELLRAKRVCDTFGRYRTCGEIEAEHRRHGDRDKAGSVNGASAATQTPSPNLGSRRHTTSLLRRVLPMPPAPTRMTRRWEVLMSRISSSSTSRPISSETGSARFVGGRDDVDVR